MHKSDAKTDITRKNIKNALKDRLQEQYGKPEIANDILKIHGIDSSKIDFITVCESAIENFINGNTINDVSIDDNSNKGSTTTEAIIQEATNPFRKLLGYDLLYREMKKLYGKEKATELTSLMYDYSLALHDSSRIDRVYCWAMNSTNLAVTGRDFTQLKSAPTKRLQSFIATLCGTMHTISGSGIAGAIAVGDFFISCSKMAMNEGYSINDIKNKKEIKKHIENCYQQFVYDMNDITRSSFESPFSNISIFDRVKTESMVKELEWFFDIKDINYIVDYIMEMQKIFIEFFDKGDVLSDGLPYRFPVVTVNFSKENDKIIDTEFLEYFCKRDIYRYNIFASEGTKVASCCRLLSDSDMLDIANQSNSFGGTGVSLGSHRVVTINLPRIAMSCVNNDSFWNDLEYLIESSAKILKSHLEFIKSSHKAGLQPFIDNGIITINRLFSTFGIVGVYECVEIIRNRFCKDYDKDKFTELLLKEINKLVLEYAKIEGINANIEQVPAESLSVKLANVDKMLFGKKEQPYKMYSNQFVPLWVESNAIDRMSEDGKYNSLITGGGIVHIQIGEKVTPKQAELLINHAVMSGCEHFALNGVFSKCENNHTSFGNIDKCSICDGEIIDKLTRVVGFMTSVKNWNKTRREWEFPKRKFNKIQ